MKKILLAMLAIGFCSLAANIPFIYKTNQFATHQPVLYELAKNTTGPIIEFGCGDGSTPLLHEICKKDHRLLISIDDDLQWLNKCREQFINDGGALDNSGWHKFYFVAGKKDDSNYDHWVKFLAGFEALKNIDFDICFIDQHPWLARYETLKLMKDKAKYIILHDCDYFPHAGIFGKETRATDMNNQISGIYDFGDLFKYSKVFFPKKPWPCPSGPPTLIGSNFELTLVDIDYSADR